MRPIRAMNKKDWIEHPGDYLKNELDARGWSQRDLAYILDCPEQSLTLILNGKRGLSAEMTKALATAFGVSEELLANLQRAYDLAHADEPDSGVAKRARIQTQYPLREMIKRGWLADVEAPMLETHLARYFEVENIDEVPHLEHAAKKTDYEEATPPVQLAWLYRVKQIAKTLVLPKYSEKALREALGKLKALTLSPEEIRQVPKILMECGVRFVIVEALPSSKIDGVCLWLDKNSPVIGMSLRLDRINNFWFVLIHEIEHVLNKHGQDKVIIDSEVFESQQNVKQEEQIANTAAENFCIPKSEIVSLIARKFSMVSEKDVLMAAARFRVHPGIVVGQIQKNMNRWDYLTKFLVKIRPYAIQGANVDGWGQIYPVNI